MRIDFSLLTRQYGIWADDEVRFHMHELAAFCAEVGMTDGDFQRPLVIDPLRFSSWFDSGSLSCLHWAQMTGRCLGSAMQSYWHIQVGKALVSGFVFARR